MRSASSPHRMLAIVSCAALWLVGAPVHAHHPGGHVAVFGGGGGWTSQPGSVPSYLSLSGAYRGASVDGPWGELTAGAGLAVAARGSLQVTIPIALGRSAAGRLGLALGSSRVAGVLRLTRDRGRRLQLSTRLQQWFPASEPGLGLGQGVFATGLALRAGLRVGPRDQLQLVGGLGARLDYGSQLGLSPSGQLGVFFSPVPRFYFGAVASLAPRWSLRGAATARWYGQLSPSLAVEVGPGLTATLGAALPLAGDEPWMVTGGVRIRLGVAAEDSS